MYLHPYRAYFKYDGRISNNGKDLTFNIVDINETQTKIDNVKVIKQDKIYTLDGIKVKSVNKRNVYIVNGKKIYIK